MTNFYCEFDDIMEDFQEARKYALDNAEYFANLKADKITYSTPSDFFLGIYTPSLLLGGIGYSKSYTKGRKLNSLGKRCEYISYEHNASGDLIRISNYGENHHSFSCLFEQNGFLWVVPVYKYRDHYCEFYKAEITRRDDSGRILIYARIDTAQIWMEKYTYPSNDPFTAICEQWNYIPKLSHSSKEKPVTETGSPAQLWIYKLDLKDDKRITGELIESYERDVSAYRKKPPCLPPPQISYKKEL